MLQLIVFVLLFARRYEFLIDHALLPLFVGASCSLLVVEQTRLKAGMTLQVGFGAVATILEYGFQSKLGRASHIA